MYAEQLLPHSIEAEEAVLGSILIDNAAFLEVNHVISPEDFYRDRHRLSYAACVELFRRGEAIDQVTIGRELQRSQNLEDAGGMAYLSHLVSITPTSTHAPHYAQLIYSTATMRRLIEAGGNITAIGYRDGPDVDASLRQAEDLLFELRANRPQRGFTSLRQIYDQFLEERATISEPETSVGPILTAYNDLDELLGGLQPSDLIILGARPGLGKSALAVNISVNAAKQGKTVGIFSLEMSRAQLGLRILAADAQVDAYRLRLGLYTESEEQRIIDSIGNLSDLPVYIDDTPFQAIPEIRSKSRRLSLGPDGLDLLIVDYLQLIQGPPRSRGSDNRVHEISEISRDLKGIARDMSIPVLTCSQLSRLVEGRPGHRPFLSDLRDSGSIEQDADIVMFIYREDLYYTEDEWDQHFPDRQFPRNIAEIIIAKHRNGLTGSVNLRFQNTLVRFDPIAPTQYQTAGLF